MLYAARAAALAANANVLAAYAGAIWPPLDGPLTIIITVGAITLVNIVGIRRAVGTLGGMTMLKLAPLILIGALGLLLAPIPTPTLPDFSAVEGVALAALYAFVGFEAATIPAGETRDPKRAIPRALLLTVAGVTLLYVLVQLAYSASGIGQSDAPLADLAAQSLGPVGALLLGITAIISVLANQLSAVTSISRITSSFADQGLLPRWFGRISPRFATPSNSIATLVAHWACTGASGGFGHFRAAGDDQHGVAAVRLPACASRRSGGSMRRRRGSGAGGAGVLLPARRGGTEPVGGGAIARRGVARLRRLRARPAPIFSTRRRGGERNRTFGAGRSTGRAARRA